MSELMHQVYRIHAERLGGRAVTLASYLRARRAAADTPETPLQPLGYHANQLINKAETPETPVFAATQGEAHGSESNSGPDLAKGPSAAPAPAKGAAETGAPSARACTTCAHRTSAGTCARPVEAELADRFAIVWPPAGHAAMCKAFERQQPAEPPRHPFGFGSERLLCWAPATGAELRRMAAVHARAAAMGFAPEEADRLADTAHWAARLGGTRPCIACARLRAGASSRWWCAAQRQPLAQQFVVQPHRCTAFSGLGAQHD